MQCLLVDSCAVYTAGFVHVLSDVLGTGSVRVAPSVERATAELVDNPPHVVLCALPDLDSAARLVRAAAPVPVLVLHWSRRRDDARAVWSAGGAGYLPKDVSPQQLMEALGDVRSGSRVFPALTDEVRRPVQVRVARRAADTAALTPRELEIVRLVLLGLPTKQVASRLGIAGQTTKNHLARAMAKAGVRSRVQLYAWAVAHGVVDEVRAAPALASMGQGGQS